jgi:DNA-binding response OmpR family regulator
LQRDDDYPTVLVVNDESDSLRSLIDGLRQDGYLVLEAADDVTPWEIVRTHSRPIHLMLLNWQMNKGVLASALKQYRPEMSVWFVTQHQHEDVLDVLTPEVAVDRVRLFFGGDSGAKVKRAK